MSTEEEKYLRNEDGKVLNPDTGNFVSVKYARREGFLEKAEQATKEYFKKQEEENKSGPIGPQSVPEEGGSLETVNELSNDDLDEYFTENENEDVSAEDFLDHLDEDLVSEEEFKENTKSSNPAQNTSAGSSMYTRTEDNTPAPKPRTDRKESEYVWRTDATGATRRVHRSELD